MALKENPNSAGRKRKDRLTILLTYNISRTDKGRPLVIGKSRSPRCFKSIENIPAHYRNNETACMSSYISEEYLRKWDSIGLLRKNVALIVDNCPAHPTELLIFLSTNTTSLIQPLDQGIIKNFNTLYRNDMKKRSIDTVDEGAEDANEVDAIHVTCAAWHKVSGSCITNCFKKSGMSVPENPDDVPTDTIDDPITAFYMKICRHGLMLMKTYQFVRQ